MREGFATYTIQLPDEVEEILKDQAKRNKRSKVRQLEWLVLEEEKKFNQKKKP